MGTDMHFLQEQTVELEKINTNGFILDIGGGGEGIIGHLNGNKVIAIDPSREELEEVDNKSMKIEMDGSDLKFLDSSFSMVTSFFTLMYIDREMRLKVLREAYRVLEPGGEMMIWDLTIPVEIQTEKEIIVIPLKIILPDRNIETGYGCRWQNKFQSGDDYKSLLEETGFTILEHKEIDQIFYFHLKKI